LHRLNNFTSHWLLLGNDLSSSDLSSNNLSNHHLLLLGTAVFSQFHNSAAALHIDVLNTIDLPSILANNAPWTAPIAQAIHGGLVPRTTKLFPKSLAQACKVHCKDGIRDDHCYVVGTLCHVISAGSLV